MKKNIDWLKEIPIAHRGLHDKIAPENSIKSFKNAISNNYAIEIDVNITKDNKIVVFHDENTYRMTGVNKNINKSTYKELLDLNLLDTNEKIPLLSDILKLINNKVPILIEIKSSDEKFTILNEVYNIVNYYNGKYCILSFDPYILEYFKIKDVDIIRGLLTSSYKQYHKSCSWYESLILRSMILNYKAKPNFIACDIDLLPDLKLQKLRNNGTILLSWTINTKEKLNKAYDYSDNIIFENMLP